ncbi:Di-and tricarboxylate transporter [Thiothrix eikelboomii]|uniref:Di-and tricarboxylate transporter n=1 Tax=Thiothrix eikelboomii TaxID=92487 RepID=A0A1T4WAY5_9GAMM|nr:SLC13 family permease [Thiothrix eikelboomii]SKA74452.1 Di-and tricarboxylate transporter [Thiothrix eikelboomii]
MTKKLVAAVIFAVIAIYFSSIAPTASVAWVVLILALTVYLFALEVVTVDVAAITIMVLIGIVSVAAAYLGLDQALVPPKQLFSGFSSNAVISIIAVMIIGAGLDKTGIMGKVAEFILKIGGSTEKSIIPLTSGSVAFISSFMQNVGAAALFLPVVSRISNRAEIPMSRLLMPMGFSAILGGTMTMIGSSPLILLNDLILTSNTYLPEGNKMHTWDLFDVTPIGLSLVIVGITYFIIAGNYVLPKVAPSDKNKETTLDYLRRTYQLDMRVSEVEVTAKSPLLNRKLLEVETQYNVRVIAIKEGHRIKAGVDDLDRNLEFKIGQVLGIISLPDREDDFVELAQLLEHEGTPSFGDLLSDKKSGIAEIVIPNNSSLINKSAIDIWMRKRYGLSLLGILRNGKTLYAKDQDLPEIRAIPFQAGDMLLVYTTWESLERLEKDNNFITITTEYPRKEENRPHKVYWALGFFLLALSLALFTPTPLALALMTGAIGMIWSGVLNIEEAYQAVSWKTVFLLASLIPLGVAVESSGTARWIADGVLSFAGGQPIWVIQFIVALLAMSFTLVMSNVGATVLLVPLAVNIAIGVDANPAVMALIVALGTSNSFILPTHQVNALIMGPGGYRVTDFMKAGSIMSLLFITVLILAVNVLGYH